MEVPRNQGGVEVGRARAARSTVTDLSYRLRGASAGSPTRHLSVRPPLLRLPGQSVLQRINPVRPHAGHHSNSHHHRTLHHHSIGGIDLSRLPATKSLQRPRWRCWTRDAFTCSLARTVAGSPSLAPCRLTKSLRPVAPAQRKPNVVDLFQVDVVQPVRGLLQEFLVAADYYLVLPHSLSPATPRETSP